MPTRAHQSGGNSPFVKGGGWLHLSAYKWMVDRKVDLTPIKELYGQKWASLEGAFMKISKLDSENDSECQQRGLLVQAAAARLHKSGLSWRDIRRVVMGDDTAVKMCAEKAPALAKDAVDLLRMPGTIVNVLHYSTHIIRNPEIRKWYGHVIMSTLSYLYENDEVELANSIWQSLRTDGLGIWEEELPDQVGEWLKTNERVRDNPWSLLQLDINRDGAFNQLWIFDRIMTDGFLWVGRYQPQEVQPPKLNRRELYEPYEQSLSGEANRGGISAPASQTQEAGEKAEVDEDEGEEVRIRAISGIFESMKDIEIALVGSDNQLHDISQPAGKEMILSDFSYLNLTPGSNLQQQVRRRAISDVFKIMKDIEIAFVNAVNQLHGMSQPSGKETKTLSDFSHHSRTPGSILRQQMIKQISQIKLLSHFMKRDNTNSLGASQASAVANLMLFAISLGSDIWTSDVERQRALQVACFDVDESCVVFTPYDAAREILPHPTTRTMKVCWVVKPLSASTGSEGSPIPRDRSNEEGTPLDTKAGAPSEGTGHVGSEHQERGGSDLEQYQIIKRVKGVWRIMEPPEQSCTFK